MTNQELSQWASSRETSALIAKAIQEISIDQNDMNQIWDDPSQEQTQQILKILIDDIDEDGLCWGMATLKKTGIE